MRRLAGRHATYPLRVQTLPPFPARMDHAWDTNAEQTRSHPKQSMHCVKIGAKASRGTTRQVRSPSPWDGVVNNLSMPALPSHNSRAPRADTVKDSREIVLDRDLRSTIKTTQAKPSLGTVPLALLEVARV